MTARPSVCGMTDQCLPSSAIKAQISTATTSSLDTGHDEAGEWKVTELTVSEIIFSSVSFSCPWQLSWLIFLSVGSTATTTNTLTLSL